MPAARNFGEPPVRVAPDRARATAPVSGRAGRARAHVVGSEGGFMCAWRWCRSG